MRELCSKSSHRQHQTPTDANAAVPLSQPDSTHRAHVLGSEQHLHMHIPTAMQQRSQRSQQLHSQQLCFGCCCCGEGSRATQVEKNGGRPTAASPPLKELTLRAFTSAAVPCILYPPSHHTHTATQTHLCTWLQPQHRQSGRSPQPQGSGYLQAEGWRGHTVLASISGAGRPQNHQGAMLQGWSWAQGATAAAAAALQTACSHIWQGSGGRAASSFSCVHTFQLFTSHCQVGSSPTTPPTPL